MRRFVTALAIAGMVVTVACDRQSRRSVGALQVDGEAEVTLPDEEPEDARNGQTIRVGDRVAVKSGTGMLDLGNSARLELRAGSVISLRTVGDSVRTDVVGGDVLVDPADGEVTVSAAGSDVRVARGPARLSQGLSLLVAAYQGTSRVDSGGRNLFVPALRQAAVPARGLLPVRAVPLAYNASDPWDQRYLSDPIELGEQLAARSRGFTAQLEPGAGRTPEFLRQLLPALVNEVDFVDSLVDPERPVGETLVGAAIAIEGRQGRFVDRWGSIFAFHDEGAPWGLVALDQSVDRGLLLAAIDAAIGRGPSLFTEPEPTPAPAPAPSTARSPSGSASPSTPTSTPPTSGSRPPGSVSAGETPPPPAASPPANTGPVRTGVPAVDQTVNSLAETLSGVLSGLGRA